MNPEDEKDFIRSALEDPRAELPPELVEELAPEERVMYQQHRILDTNLRSGLKDLTAHLEASAAREDAFKARLLEGIKKEPAPAGMFWLRLKIKDGLEKLRELFWYEPGPVYRWTPALILLLVLPMVPLVINEQAKQEMTLNDAPVHMLETGKAEEQPNKKTAMKAAPVTEEKPGGNLKQKTTRAGRGRSASVRKPASPKSAAPNNKEKKDFDAPTVAARSIPAGKNERNSAGAPAAEPAADDINRARTAEVSKFRETEKKVSRLNRQKAKAAPRPKRAARPVPADAVPRKETKQENPAQPTKDAREQELLTRLQKARTTAEKRKVLKELEQYYLAKSAVEKLRRIREKLQTFK